MKPPVPFYWRGNHHGYYGIFFLVFGLFNIYMGIDNGPLEKLIPFWALIAALGIWMIIDDIIEHTITANTPMRIIYRFIFKVND